MDDPVVFKNFVNNMLGVTEANTLTAITQFMPTFNDLMGTDYTEIESFLVLIVDGTMVMK